MKKGKKIAIISLIVVVTLVLVCFAGVGIYASDYRTLDENFYYVLEDAGVTQYDDMVHFEADSDVGLVFYQGGRVDYLAYAPLMQKLQQAGINVFLVDTAYNMACFGINKASAIMEEYTAITNWYVGGHSLGGVMANVFASNHSDEINGLVMLGIYLSSDYDVENTITIYGSNDLRVGDSVTYTTNVHVIEGGNHAQFGNYGPNDGDGVATITTEEQQNITVELVSAFMNTRNK
ncbi:MAG: alpha/beta hydrolase [Bacillota bacterium]